MNTNILQKTFIPYIQSTHLQYANNFNTHPKLTYICQAESISQPENIIFSFIITIAPMLDLCETKINNITI
jgi:hypothetical protein